MTPEGLEKLKEHEGLRLNAYKCTAGVWTIGYGHTSDRHEGVYEGLTITKEEAEHLLYLDVAEAEADARKVCPNFDTHSPGRQDALVNMAFQMGYAGLSKFTDFLALFRAGKYRLAALDLEHTKWHRQTNNRAHDVINMIMEG
jgi:lysozyme